MVQSLFDRLGIKQWVDGLVLEHFKGLINNENNCERNFAKIVEIFDHQTAERSSKQSSDPAYYIRD